MLRSVVTKAGIGRPKPFDLEWVPQSHLPHIYLLDSQDHQRPDLVPFPPLILALPPSLLRPPVMIIQLAARNTSQSLACAQENSYCLSAQIENTDTSSTTGATHTPFLIRRNLIGVLVIAALLVLGTALWLCFGKWSKPIRHFFKKKLRSSSSRHNTGATPLWIDNNGPRAVAAQRSVPDGADAEKAEIMDSSSSSTQSSLLDQDAIKTDDGDKVEVALPAKVLQIKSGSRLAGLVR